MDERASDEELCQYLETIAQSIRGKEGEKLGKRKVEVLGSNLIEQLPPCIR